MAAESVVGALIGRWSSVTTSGFPQKLWFGEAPLYDSSGAVALPYVVLIDRGTTPDFDLEENPIERTEVTFEIYAVTLAEADSIAKRIKYGGAAFTAGSGYDFASSLDFASGIRLFTNGVQRTREQRYREAARDGSAQPVHRIEIDYTVTTLRTGV